jgi:hypothetical protein
VKPVHVIHHQVGKDNVLHPRGSTLYPCGQGLKHCLYLPGGVLHVHVLHPRGSTLYPCGQGLKHCLYLPGGGLHVHVLHPRGGKDDVLVLDKMDIKWII